MQLSPYRLRVSFQATVIQIDLYDAFDFLISSKKLKASVSQLSPSELKGLLSTIPEFEVKYQQIDLICESENFTLVPQALFKPEDAIHYLQFLSEPMKNQQVLHQSVPALDLTLVFEVPALLFSVLSDLFPNVYLQHHLTPIFHKHTIAQSASTQLHCWVREKKMDLVLFHTGQLLIANTFPFNTQPDFLYYVLNVFDKLKLDALSSKVLVYNSDGQPHLTAGLDRYVRKVQLCKN